VVLYGRETWSLALREKYRLSVFENRVLRGIFGLKRDEVMGVCITSSFMICVLFAKYNYNDQVGEDMGGTCSTNGGEEERV
jgi:hypothetical protein